MSKMSEMDATIKELRDIASSINDIANRLTGAFSSNEEASPYPEPAKAPAVTHEKIRALAVRLSRNGKREEIKRLIEQYGVKNITAIADDDLDSFYSELAAMEVE